MTNSYKIRYKSGDLEIEVESTDKAFVETKIQELLSKSSAPKDLKQDKIQGTRAKTQKETQDDDAPDSTENGIDVMRIVNAINDSEHHDLIDKNIFSKSNQLNRVLLVFYFVNSLYPSTSITTGLVEKVTDQLKVRVKQNNAATTIKANSKFFTADNIRKKGAVVNYRLNRKGVQEFEKLLGIQ